MTAYPRFAPPDDFSDGVVLRGPRRDARIQAEIEAAHEAGRQDGFRAALDEIAARQADALQAIARQMQLLLSRLGPESEALRGDCADLAVAVGRALAGAALAENGAALAEYARIAGHFVEMEVIDYPSAPEGDVTLSWEGGAIVRSGAAIDEAVAQLVADWRALGDLETEPFHGDGAR